MRSRWSMEIGRVMGIPVRIHATFLLLLIWFGWVATQQGGSFLGGVAFILLLFGCVALHELGHAVAGRRFGVETREIVLYPIGGVARLRGMPSGLAELVIAAAGPLVNLVLAVGILVAMVIGGVPFPTAPEELLTPEGLLVDLLVANVLLFAFNLIPAFPMDGGRILRAALSMATSPLAATRVAAAVGQAFALLFAFGGILTGNFLLLLIGVFVFFGAGQEAAVSRRRAWLDGRRVRDAMVTRFERLAPHDSLGQAAQLLLRTPQSVFPVVDGWGRVAGILGRGELLGGLHRLGSEGAVLDLPLRQPRVVSPEADLAGALGAGGVGSTSLPFVVEEDGRLVGLVTDESLANLVAIVSRMT